jgi:hypothetical protein
MTGNAPSPGIMEKLGLTLETEFEDVGVQLVRHA